MPTVVYDSKKSLQEKILRGVDVLAENVASTLGPRGRNVILKQKDGTAFITKDGVTVAKFIHLDDHFEDLGAQIIKQASKPVMEPPPLLYCLTPFSKTLRNI